MKRKLLKLIKQKEFVFTILIYPLLVFMSVLTNTYLQPIKNADTNLIYYCISIFIFTVFITVITFIEVIKRLFLYELQGDKLKIREREGINIDE